MEKGIEDLWKHLSLTEDEEVCVVVDGNDGVQRFVEEQFWMVGKLLTMRPFNKQAMMSMLK